MGGALDTLTSRKTAVFQRLFYPYYFLLNFGLPILVKNSAITIMSIIKKA